MSVQAVPSGCDPGLFWPHATLEVPTSMLERRLIEVEGSVQGVGFRPYVHRLASERDLRGFVQNEAHHVFIDVEGDVIGLDAFCRALTAAPPPLSRIARVRVTAASPCAYRSFEIAASVESARTGGHHDVPGDVATCERCLADLFSPTNRRFGHPFITCTDCGPRFTVVHGVPYDRARTSMADFAPCAECMREYHDSRDRRFHAESIACPACGPRLRLLAAHGGSVDVSNAGSSDEVLAVAVATINDGGIVAIKALGGFQLACDATNEHAVARMRRRKNRPAKPLAVMVGDVASALHLVVAGDMEIAALTDNTRPVVVMRRCDGGALADSVAPGRATIGLMLPSTPLHHLLLHRLQGRPLVMTSGNRAGDPLATDDETALATLRDVADLFLTHDRAIVARCDDSVVRTVAGAPRSIRRARGHVPRALRFPSNVSGTVLATGAHLKNTICIAHGTAAHLSAHIGDLDGMASMRAMGDTVQQLILRVGAVPDLIAHDLHPDYGSTRFAETFAAERGIEQRVPVQHHHAHVAACIAEHELEGPVIGVAFDGAGLGTDDAIWGGEFLVVEGARFTRHGHLAYVPLPGGDAAARAPWRSAAAHLGHAGEDSRTFAAALPPKQRRTEWALVQQLLSHQRLAPRTSSVGRLFDAVASILGLCHVSRYEGDAAIALEEAAGECIQRRYDITLTGDARWTADPAPIVRGVMSDRRLGRSTSQIAAAFHAALRDLIVLGCERIREGTGIAVVALSGGVFANALLAESAIDALRARRFMVHLPRTVPCNDGGLALGQAFVARCALREEQCA